MHNVFVILLTYCTWFLIHLIFETSQNPTAYVMYATSWYNKEADG